MKSFNRGARAPIPAWRWAAGLFIACLAGSVVLAVSYVVSRNSQDDELLATQARAVSATVEVLVHDAGDQARAVAALFHSSEYVTAAEFNRFVEDVGLTPGMFGLGFVAVVDHADLADFERILEANHPGAFVFEIDEVEQQPIPVPERDTYYPIQFLWTTEGLPGLGFDVSSDMEFASAIDRTLKTGGLTASGFLDFPGLPEGGSWVIFEPVFGSDGEMVGMVAAAMDLGVFLAAAIPAGAETELDLKIHDINVGVPLAPENALSESIRAANRAWRVDVIPLGGASQVWGALAFVAGGLFTGTALGLAVLAVTARLRQRREVDELRSLDRQKDDFLATVSHELRTPLTSIVGFADALREGNGQLSRADQVEMIDFIADEADAMEGIVQDLLVVARLQQHGVVPITCRAIDDLAAEVRKIADQAAIVRSSPTTVSGNASAFADPARLRQILRNLFDNSVRHGLPPIEVTIQADGEQVRVRVQDSGPGVGVAEVPRLFDRYRSGPNPEGLPSSTGIGLWLSRELARLMGGDLCLIGTGKGAAFELTLPVTGGGQCAIEPSTLAEQAVGF